MREPSSTRESRTRRIVAGLSCVLLLLGPVRAADPVPGKPPLAPPAPPDTLKAAPSPAPASPSDSLCILPDGFVPPADSLGAAADSLAADSLAGPGRFARVRYRALPDSSDRATGLPGLPFRPRRPVEDALDEWQPLVLGPAFDLAQVGHRQELALDGLDPGEGALLVDGLDAGSRITGRADLGGLGGGLFDPSGFDPWERLAPGRPAGAIALERPRADSDSVLTRVRWADGFLGLVSTEVDFRRPWLGGRLAAGTRQVFTHGSRAPGSWSRGNDFFWNYDRALAVDWRLRWDQSVLRDEHDLLWWSDGTRRRQSRQQRLRLEHRLDGPLALEADLWQRLDGDRVDRDAGTRHDLARLRGAALHLRGSEGASAWRITATSEHQRLSSQGWTQRQLDSRLEGDWRRPLGALSMRLNGALGKRSDVDALPWTAGGSLAGANGPWRAEALLQRGRRLPWPEQLHLVRDPATLDLLADPWLRWSGRTLLPNAELGPTDWLRQELRLRWKREGRQAGLRLWRVELGDQPVPVPGQFSDEDWSWAAVDHVQSGQQAWLDWPLPAGLDLRLAQAWFHDSGNRVSYEYPTLLLDGDLGWRHGFFDGELDVRATLGARLEHGGVDRLDASLWGNPEVWLKGSARHGRFTLGWALRNPFGLAQPQRVEGFELHGHEEWLSVEWNFFD